MDRKKEEVKEKEIKWWKKTIKTQRERERQ